MAKSQTNYEGPTPPLEDGGRRGVESQMQSDAAVNSPEATMRRLEEMERRLKELDKALDLRSDELDRRQQQDTASMGQRLFELQNALPGRNLVRIGSGIVLVVEPGEFIAYDSQLGLGTNVIGGWIKAPEGKDTKVTPRLCQVSIAMERFSYDPKFGCPQHQVKQQAYKMFFQDPERDPVVGPPHLLPITAEVRRVRGLALAG